MVTGAWTAEAERAVANGEVDGLWLNYARGFSEPTLDFLDSWPLAKRIADAIRAHSDADAAQGIDDAIDGGSTASEILFGLRWEFARLLQAGAITDDGLAAEIAELKAAIDRALE